MNTNKEQQDVIMLKTRNHTIGTDTRTHTIPCAQHLAPPTHNQPHRNMHGNTLFHTPQTAPE